LSNLQQNNTDLQQVTVEFKEAVQIEKLKAITGVSSAAQLSIVNYQLSTKDAESVKKQLLQISIENNWDIVSLQTQVQSMEDVFRDLTKQ